VCLGLKKSSKITKHILASLRFSNISEILSNQVEEEKKCLPEEIFSKKNENKFCLPFRVPFVVMRIIFTTKYIFSFQ